MFDIGSSLREARLRQELDFPELEERTKIRPKYLRALEDEHFDMLPAPTYVTGFLRSYAEALGLDGQPFVDEYNSRFTVGEDDAPLRATERPASASRPRSDASRGSPSVALVAIAIAHGARHRGVEVRRPGGREGPRPRSPARRRRVDAAAEGHARSSSSARATGNSWMEVRADVAPRASSCTAGRSSKASGRTFEGTSLQLALAKPQNVVVRLNGNRVELPGRHDVRRRRRRGSSAATS